jgi:hypothetical protein
MKNDRKYLRLVQLAEELQAVKDCQQFIPAGKTLRQCNRTLKRVQAQLDRIDGR